MDIFKQINTNLEQQAQAIFKSWFIDFEPFGGTMPKDWRITSLSDIAEFIGGYSYKGNELAHSNIGMATIKNFERNGGFKLNGYKEIIPSIKFKATQQAELFDTLVAHTDLTQNADVIGNAEIILSKASYQKIIFSMDLVKVIPKKGCNLSKFMLAALLKTKDFKSHCLGYINGTTVLHLSKQALPEYHLAFPDNPTVLQPLDALITAIYKQLVINFENTITLAILRDTLLPKLMSGEIDVSKIELE